MAYLKILRLYKIELINFKVKLQIHLELSLIKIQLINLFYFINEKILNEIFILIN